MKTNYLLLSGLLTFLCILCSAGAGYAVDARPEAAALDSERSAQAMYFIADLAGKWETNSLASGPGAPWWERGNMTIASDGTFTVTTSDSDGSGDHFSGIFNITSQGMVTPGGNSNSNFSCNLNTGRTVIACTTTWASRSPGTTELKLFTKKAASYSMVDLSGIWNINALASGPGAPFWDRLIINVDTNGSCSGQESSNDGSSGSISGTCSISADGTVTFSFANPSARCTMNSSKTVIACTSTWPLGSPGTTDMGIGTKRASSYSPIDLTGTWNFHGLASGPGAPWWDRTTLVIKANGTLTGTSLGSDGSTDSVSGTSSISADGTVTFSFANPPNRCTMDASRTVIACTSTWPTGTTYLTVGLKSASPGNSACDATLNSDLTLRIPVLTFADQYYWADFQYVPNTLDFALTNAGVVEDPSPYSGCFPASLSSAIKLHLPAVTFNGNSYWLDMTYSQGATLTLTGAGQN